MRKSFLFLLLLSSALSMAADNYTFNRDLPTGPRGGNTLGPKVELDKNIPSTWSSLQERGISSFERDRRAILGLQGQFEVSFEFMETFIIDSPKKLDTPYFSKATEYVQVIEDKGDFISLQHILIMFFVQDGNTIGPFVTKHWRQDWKWEAEERFVFQGQKHWKLSSIEKEKSKGNWTWSVFQVDDSPRYTGIGKWNHTTGASFFDSSLMSRPLPRREFSVRDDYKLLMGRESLVLTKNNWYHEQKAFKHAGSLVDGKFSGSLLSREIGINTYKRIKDFNWTAGKDYWAKTSKYWADVRAVWRSLFSKLRSIKLHSKVDGVSLHEKHFKQAEDSKVLAMNSKARRELIRSTIKKYLK